MERVDTFEATQADYSEDVAAWAGVQVALLKSGRLQDADIEHIIEEIQSLGASERTAIASQIDRIIEHLLKLIFSPAQDPRRGWRATIRDARNAIERQLDQSPSLRRELAAMVAKSLPRASRSAADSLLDFGELVPGAEQAVLRHSFTVDQVTGNWFPPEA